MNNIDRLFNDTLQSHSTPAPAGLWERVESGLPVAGTTSRLSWMRWAAIIVPAMVAVGMWMSRPEDQASSIAVDTNPITTNPSEVVPSPANRETVAAVAKRPARVKTTRQLQVVAQDQPIQAAEVRIVEELPLPEEIAIEPEALESETIAAETETPKAIVIVYTLETVAAPDDAARKETSLDKVVEFARTVKHSDPISDIRGLKDELFAFDFRKKQTKKN